jgi:hypothetical protein
MCKMKNVITRIRNEKIMALQNKGVKNSKKANH